MQNAAPSPVATPVMPAAAPLHLVRPSPAPLGVGGALGTAFELTQGTFNVIEGAPGSWGAVALGTAVRAGLIAGGFWLTGTRQWKPLLFGSLAASGLVTVVLLAGHAVLKRTR